MKLKETENIFILGIFLGIVGGIAALILAYFADLTKKPIAEMKMKATNSALKEVLPAFDNSPGQNKVVVDSVDNPSIKVAFFGAFEGGKLVGVAGQSYSPKGYSGKIQAMVGLEPKGKIRTVAVVKAKDKDGKGKSDKISAVLITEQNETPGLGTVVCGRKREVTIFSLFDDKKKEASALPPNPILDQFAGMKAGKAPWKVVKDGGKLEYMTGATISSRAVADVVYRIAHTYQVNSKKIVADLKANNKKAAK
jgi:electron transport complex protein RnfG